MKQSLIAFAALAALAACDPAATTTSASAEPPLASEEQITAAETAPLGPQATDARWNEPFAPFNVMGNIYYVGAGGVSSYLITTPEGHILIDGGLPQTAPQILANIATLGFDVADVKFLLNSHAHYDHAGGLARLRAASGATFVASDGDRPTLEAGRVDYGPSASIPFPAIRVERVIADGETLTLGGVTLTAYITPGHTKGCTSWSAPVAGADGAQHVAFFHCSASVGGHTLEPEDYPGIVADYRNTFARIRTIQADMLLGNHPSFFNLEAKRARQIAGDANAFVDAGELQRFNIELETAFNAELGRRTGATP